MLLTFLSDYGYDDEFAGACRAVIARLAPDARVVDLTHGIAPGDVRRGALALEAAVERSGPAVHLAVVDPGVGTDRRALAITAGESFLVGPDNGLLTLAAQRLGGAAQAWDVSRTPLRLEPVAATFHGRDIFAPVAAHLASGRPGDAIGDAIGPESLKRLCLPDPVHEGDVLVAHVLYADRFGNLVLDARPDDLAATGPIALSVGDRSFAAVRGRSFADGEEGVVVYDDSSGRLGIAVDLGSAAELLEAGRDDEIRLAVRQ
jgi:S-adenosyl-L-methionine hydrolase (adenosine-forming)